MQFLNICIEYMSLCVCVCLSKKILTLGLKNEVPPHSKAVQLQKMVRYSATLFVQVTLRHTQSA